jgi:hypothetical protein
VIVVQGILGNSAVCAKAVFVAVACCMQHWVSAALGDTLPHVTTLLVSVTYSKRQEIFRHPP